MSNVITYSAFESRYKDRQYIGSGGFAKVYKVFDHVKNHYVALKIADVKPEWNKFTLKNEVELVNKLPQHRNIARYDACYRFNTGSLTGEMDFAILRFYEYGNLEQFLKKQETTAEDKRLLVQGILDGIAFLHKNKVIHRDLKAQNILLHREDGIWTPKITDFGLSREVLESGDITNSAIGVSYAYAAPEQIQNSKIYKNVDLWAAGVIIYRIIADELPFKGRSSGDDRSTQSQLELSRKIINLELPDTLNAIAEPYQSMIRRCLVLKPEERVQTAEELIEILHGANPYQSSAGTMTPPVQENKAVEDAKTEILNPYAAQQDTPPAAPPQQQGNPSMPVVDDKTEVIQNRVKPEPSENMPPSSFAPPPGFPPAQGEYEIPKSNVTQYINKKSPASAEEAPPDPVSVFQPKTGGRKRGFNWRWVLVPLLVMVAGAGGFYWYLLQQKGVPAPDEEKPTLVVKDRLDPLDKKIEAFGLSGGSASTLESLQTDLATLVASSANDKNYRPRYLSAKLAAYTESNPRLALNALIAAAKTAIENGDAKRMLADLKADESIAFEEVKKRGAGYWNNIVKSLEEAN